MAVTVCYGFADVCSGHVKKVLLSRKFKTYDAYFCEACLASVRKQPGLQVHVINVWKKVS